MRHFYLFDIDKKSININKTHPYSLFKLFYELYNGNRNNYDYYKKIYGSIIKPIKRKKLNNNLYDIFKTNLFYTKFMNNHYYNDYLENEETKIVINNSYIKVDTNNVKPTFFGVLNKYSNLFVCDFDNNDYFYLENVD